MQSGEAMIKEMPAEAWDGAVRRRAVGSVFLTSAWEAVLVKILPYVSFEHVMYRDTHIIRLTRIRNRYTSTPFAEGGDVLALRDGAVLDAEALVRDLKRWRSKEMRLRIYERMASVSTLEHVPVRAHEYTLSLDTPLLPRVRKTLRHILNHGIDGEVVRTAEERDLDRSYKLYVAHMRAMRNLALPRAAFGALTNELGAQVWVWRIRGRAEAMAVFMPSENEVLYAMSASSAKGAAMHASHHLVYTALEHYRKKGIRRASLGSTGADSALTTFKRGWRGEQHAVYELGGAEHESARTSPLRSLMHLIPLSLYPAASSLAGKYVL